MPVTFSSLSFIVAFPTRFFFQAEDGIRDLYVTGVQTCALPISDGARTGRCDLFLAQEEIAASCAGAVNPRGGSEERRVGKECRSRWSAYHQRKNDGSCRRTKISDRQLYNTAILGS